MAAHRPRLLLRRRRAQPAAARPSAPSASSASSATSSADAARRDGRRVRRRRRRRGARRSTTQLLPVVRRASSAPRARSWPRPRSTSSGCPAAPVRLPLRRRHRRGGRAAACSTSPPAASTGSPHEPPAPRARPAARRCPTDGLRVVALGGLGEIGRNMTVFEYAGRLLVVDCGVLFPEDDQPGVDLILPGLRLHPGPARRHRRRSCSPTATRTTSAPCPYLLREQPDIPLDRLAADARPGRGQAHGAPDQAVHARGDARASASSSGRSTASSSRSTTRSPTRSPSRSAPPAGTRAAHRRLQDGPAAARRPASPTCAPSPGSARRASTCFLVDSTNAEVPGLRHARARDRAGARRRSSRSAEQRIIVACFASPRAPRPAGARRRRTRTAARSPSSAARWCATWASPRDLGYLHVPDGPARRRQGARRPARRPGRAGLHRLAGRADGGAVPDGQPRPPDPDRRGRHRAARVLADPRQRERRLPGHQRADPAGARTSCTRATPRCTSPATPRAGELALLLQHRPAAQRHAGARRVAAPARQRRARRPHRRPARARRASPRTASSSTWSTAGATIVGAVPCGYVYVDGSSRRRGHRGLAQGPPDPAATRASSRSSSSSTRRPARSSAGPEIHARGFAEDDAVFDDGPPADRGGARGRRRARASPTPHQLAAGRPPHRRPAGSATRYRRRPMIIPVVVEV